jgi:hypothetical protein
MGEYRLKIRSLQDKINKLRDQELVLVKKRKEFVGDLGERFNLLTYSDECLAGLLNDCREMLSVYPHRVGEYEEKGKVVFGKKSRGSTTQTNSKSLSQSTSIEAALE